MLRGPSGGPRPVEGNGERGPAGGPRPVEGQRRSGQGGQDESCPGRLHL